MPESVFSAGQLVIVKRRNQGHNMAAVFGLNPSGTHYHVYNWSRASGRWTRTLRKLRREAIVRAATETDRRIYAPAALPWKQC